MKTVEQIYKINAPIARVWQAFIDPKIINEWGGGPAKMDDKEGSEFSLWGGEIHGTNTKLIKDELLQQDWFSGDKWDKASKVSFNLKQKGDITEVKLVHSGIPDKEAEDIDLGWKNYYLGPLKDLLEK